MHTRSTPLLLAAVIALAGVTAVPATAHPVAAKHKKHHHHHGIPQHGGGDADGDNSGGPSDSDGNV